MAEIRRANKAAGLHFFDADTMRFFRSRIESERPIGGRYFVTSEQFVPRHLRAVRALRWAPEPRRFTVRRANDDGSISTVGKVGEFATLPDARAEARAQATTANPRSRA